MTRVPISRRHALALLGLGTAGVAAGATGWATGLGASGGTHLKPADTGEPLHQPAMLESRDGVLDVTLTAAAGVRLAGHDTSAWGFNGTSPGSTLRVRPGDLLRVRLVNRIDLTGVSEPDVTPFNSLGYLFDAVVVHPVTAV